jgi:hypothetical protein
MNDNFCEYVAKPIGAPVAAHETAQFLDSVSHDATYKVRFNKFWGSSYRPIVAQPHRLASSCSFIFSKGEFT